MMRLRREFSPDTKRAARERAAGVCECQRVPQLMAILRQQPCGCRLGPGDTFYEHVIPDELGGDNTLENCAILVRTCWRLKTDLFDLPAIADAARQQDRHSGIGGPGRGRFPMRGGRFSPETRGIDGRVKPRRRLTERMLAAGLIHPDALAAAMADDPTVCLVVTRPHPQPVTE